MSLETEVGLSKGDLLIEQETLLATSTLFPA
jgi:hypothetical protein